MLTRGLLTPGRYLRKYRVLVLLLVTLLLLYIFRKKVIISTTSNDIYNLLLSSGLSDELCRYMTAQGAHETAGFTSNIFKNNNNAFGMKYAGQVNSLGEKNGYANYKSINHSVADLVAWYTRHRINIFSLPLYIGSLASYVKFLKNNNYFEADEAAYLKGCQHFYNEIF